MNTAIMRRCISYSVLPLMLLCTVVSFAQERPIDNALLWKVTGKSLLKPSFLFGTIHLQDQRVFNFNDSLYSFIKYADGFAMEVHPDSVVAALMQKADERETGRLLKQELSKDEFNRVSRKLRKELGVDANKLTLKQAYLLRDHLDKPEPRADDMPTFVDAYLFGVARNQGKEIVGLEKAIDQANMLEDIKGEFDVRSLLKTLKKDKSLTERLVQLYIREDLTAIHDLMSYMPEEVEDKLLNLRNEVMADKMDSLIQAKSFVVAVGTAHLPGKKGIIELLRQKGYTVEPVYTTSRTHANNYAIKAEQKFVWVDVNEPQLGYSTRMPGKPSPMDMLNGGMKMNMYMDLASMKAYYTAFVVPGINITKQNVDSMLTAMSKNAMAASGGQTISKTRFVKDNFEGIDFLYKQTTDKMFARVQALAMGKRIYLIGFGSPRQDDLTSQEAKDFFAAFKLLDMPENTWEVQTFPEQHFRIALPSQGKLVQLKVADTSIRSVQINSMDNNKGAYYGLTVVTANAGFTIPNDSAYFSSNIEHLKEIMQLQDLVVKDTSFQGFNATLLKAKMKDDLRVSCFMINRGNRVYNLAAITTAEDTTGVDIPAFYNSFAFIDYPQPQWHEKKDTALGFTVPLISSYTKTDFTESHTDTTKSTEEYQWVAYDSVSATSFYVTRRLISPYMWAKHDSILLKHYMKQLSDYKEAVTDYKFVRNGGSNGIEFNVKRSHTSLGQRIRILINDSAVYTLQTDVPVQYWNKGYDRFLQDFRFAKDVKPSFLYTNSLQHLLNDLASTDSAKYSKALFAINDMMYDSADIPALLKAATSEYPLDTMQYFTAADKFMDEVSGLEYSKLAETVASFYNGLKPEQEKYKFGMLNALAKHKTTQSYTMLEKLLKQGIPSQGQASRFISNLGDSLELTKQLYPYLITLSADTLMGTPLFYLHERMLDSSIINISEFKSREPLVLKAARQQLAKANASKDDYYYVMGLYNILTLLKAIGTDSSIALLRKFAAVRQVDVKYDAVMDLLKIDQQVDAATLLSLAADKEYRTSLYSDLKDLKKEKLFPSKYFTQKAFAEGYAYAAANDESSGKVSYVGERTLKFKGKKYKFYLYKAVFGGDEEVSSYLCISGAFSTDGRVVPIEEDISGIYWDEEFSKSDIDKQLRAYLASWEEDVDEVKIGTLDEEKE